MVQVEKTIIRVGRWGVDLARGAADFWRFSWNVFASLRHLKSMHLRSMRDTIFNQIYFTGVHALKLVLIVSILLGGTVIIQSMKNFPKFGIETFLSNLLVIIIGRELGPLVTAVIVISRSGSAIAAEVATQKQNQEIRSLELMGIDTDLYIVIPRIIASIVSIFTLIALFDMAAFFGGYLISLTSIYIPIGEFTRGILQALSGTDLLVMLIKSTVYGVLIPLICCYYGFKPTTFFHIPFFVSKAVVRTLLAIFLINAVLSVLFYL